MLSSIYDSVMTATSDSNAGEEAPELPEKKYPAEMYELVDQYLAKVYKEALLRKSESDLLVHHYS